ncbi:type IV pilus modification protein PilV [Neisseria animalis]|uniref:Type IV pilus modification protein PilV n=1 Tax=Neisseria animalis TaxID=492 RepID=A0A5P3MRX7_NEIAN|nr:type IV pilus modification protein PilV [Neisseria animalis]QEY24353.1 type IV pilus modification protein PilV [Neisseria animalis]ROW31738.1 type IV pilus modification protein PilV [Neisseria animalis]VEE06856.1 type IV pilus assembly protein PilV [Neisseria animalis]
MMMNIKGKATVCRLQNGQQGVTLIEVLVSVFVLTVGILALLSVHLRAVSGVREAEGQSAVSLVAQNLLEGMAANPVLMAENADGLQAKSYRHYYRSGQAAACAADYSAVMTATELAAVQLCRFQNDLAAVLPETAVYYAVCKDSSGNAPTVVNGRFNPRCNNRGEMTVIKTAWLADLETENAETAGSLTHSGDSAVYTFQVRLAE